MTITTQKVTYRAFREMDFPDGDTFLYELLNGVIVRKSAPHIIHQRILRKLVRRFEDFILEAGAGEVFFAPVDVVLSNENAPQPDLVFVSQANAAIIDVEEGIINGCSGGFLMIRGLLFATQISDDSYQICCLQGAKND